MNLVWLRNDLRLEDNPALHYASKQGEVCCVYTVTEKQWLEHDDAPAKIMLWRDRLLALSDELAKKNIPLKIINVDYYNDISAELFSLIEKLNVDNLFFNIEYPLNEKKRDKHIIGACEARGITVHIYHADVIHPPGRVTTQNNTTYHVYSPFARQWRKQLDISQLDVMRAPAKQKKIPCESDNIETHWHCYDREYRDDLWLPTTKAVQQKLKRFAESNIEQYKALRDIPSIPGTSTLSPYLACGAISVRQCIAAAREHSENWLENTWVNELIWREFYRHLIDIYPHLSRSENFKATKNPIPWQNDERQWQAWCKGETGYPIVDAAMKQLIQTGWMHNRLRMVVAAFLTKLLLIDWRKGEAFFMRYLVDGDYASNNGGWQWAASTGADAAPYFRIFSPERQSQRFDPEGKFIKKLLPELSDLDKKSIHTPSSDQRKACGYPEPIIDYKFARQRALDGYASAMGKVKTDSE
ncbi:MAG: deoxyribodipyrimidine photo-lyase [Cellvibrionaceae bacterium]|jgi:deoxyribodipyrimidine photo-lyase